MKPNSSLVELVTSSWQTQKHFELMASINNVNYQRCLIIDGSLATAQRIFDCIKEKISQICPLMSGSAHSQLITTTFSTVVGNFSNSNIII
ncbi:unnamed protein product [Rotaria sp. Silwood2]|nr:unnamed protein product [Rotaria sp. Silwood2]